MLYVHTCLQFALPHSIMMTEPGITKSFRINLLVFFPKQVKGHTNPGKFFFVLWELTTKTIIQWITRFIAILKKLKDLCVPHLDNFLVG